MHMTRWLGFFASSARRSRVKPNTAFVGCPFGPVIVGMPWKFWNTSE